ncbi:hypothetical protein CQ010_10180 [Arthrobacter sp. MYb211]|uniref:hypothetical protein n=1 Tax=Micrococcaceae TaxID=1268 RepID=UPI000BB84A3D|nr:MULTISPECIES: hypothetical protein [Micrococcaceae]PCC30178.1 hypothetical protein CIK76_03565 [Glutamicibacter sp. BW80]PQZ99504.1 hypothetical protein CQ017_07515 [Arthrobacter sp. MYb224]PRA06030.1 hypothetical protein CQ019_01005 [Arthrobacter sp. MYb229]PRA11200.1 hypothetical protein CQ015_09960 [Arthrobacter sp. MYb221]PRB52932.1 hypothetical protein CQ013_01005 [Arthrobacter sp. MYb216]
MADMFLEKFRSLVPKYLEDQWNEADGLTAEELAEGLAQSGVSIPFVLEEFYLAVGNNEDFTEAYHFFFDPEELEIDGDYLLFLEDEEEKYVWGFKASQLDVPDPIVYRRNNAKGTWVSEEGTFSEFTLDLFSWVFEELAAELDD